MDIENKSLLYRIDEENKIVIVVLTDNDEKTWKNISDSNYTIFSFYDIIKGIKDFSIIFPEFEPIFPKLLKNQYGGWNDINPLILKIYSPSENFFIQYYINKIRYNFTNGKDVVYHDSKPFSLKVLKQKKEELSLFLNNIRNSLNIDRILDINSDNYLMPITINSKKVYIHRQEFHECFYLADDSLINLIYDLSYAINKLKLSICTCRYCNNKFYGKENAVCCDSEVCILSFNQDIRKANRRERDNSTYNLPQTRLSNYLGQKKSNLPSKVLSNPELVNEFLQQRKIFTKKMKFKINEYKKEKRVPNDEEFKAFYKRMKQDIAIFCNNLEKKA